MVDMKTLNLQAGDCVSITYEASDKENRYCKLATLLGKSGNKYRFIDSSGRFDFSEEFLERADIEIEVIDV